jgi:hypothetical protein
MDTLMSSWIAAVAALAMSFATASFAAQSGGEKDAVVNKEVAKAITEAKKQAERKQWDAALAALQTAERSPQKTDYAEYKIQQFKGYVLTQQRKYAQAAPIFAKLGVSEQASAQERGQHLKTAAQLYLQERQYKQAASAATSALKLSPADSELLELAGQSRYMAGDFSGAATALEQLLSRTRKQEKTPDEDWLQVLLNAYYKLGDEQKIASTWEALLRYHPKQEYWRNVLARRTAKEHSEQLELGYQRLMFEVGLLKDPKDYEELAMSAIEAGAAEEAVRLLSSGLDSGALGGAERARFERMRAYAQAEAEKSRAQLAQLSKDAERASTGQPSVELGRAYLGQQQYDRAIAALRQGLSKGKLEDPGSARVLLGIAYLKKQQPEEAREAFAAVEASSDWRDLADLWSLRALAPTAAKPGRS